MTPYKTLKGQEFKNEMLKIGECVCFLKPKSKGKNKTESRCPNGIWLGVREESGEYIVGTSEGVFKVRTVRRKGLEEDSWNWEEFSAFRGLPWEPIPGRPGIEMTANSGKEREPREVQSRTTGEEKVVHIPWSMVHGP